MSSQNTKKNKVSNEKENYEDKDKNFKLNDEEIKK